MIRIVGRKDYGKNGRVTIRVYELKNNCINDYYGMIEFNLKSYAGDESEIFQFLGRINKIPKKWITENSSYYTSKLREEKKLAIQII